jgi:trimethylamine:corrinoid methyltransferase-like protein
MQSKETAGRRQSRSGGRRQGIGARRAATAAAAPAYTRLRNPFRPIELFSEDRIEAIHDASLTILEEIGLRILHPGARALFKGEGGEVDVSSLQVRLDRGLVQEWSSSLDATRSGTWRSAATPSPSARWAARPMSPTWTAGAGRGRWPTSKTCCAWRRPTT